MRNFEVVFIHHDYTTADGYGHEGFSVGDVIALSGDLADKAASNPDFKEIIDAPKKKRGRPRKEAV